MHNNRRDEDGRRSAHGQEAPEGSDQDSVTSAFYTK